MSDSTTEESSNPTPSPSAGAEPAPVAEKIAPPPPPLSMTELQRLSSEQLESLARKHDIHLFPARSRHYHILDIVRAALQRRGTVTAEGFLDDQGEGGPI